jgi:hypothetical protein
MDLVTLTFKRDLRHTVLQAESIQKFVAPCDHWIIVNEVGISEKRKERWRKILQPFYTKHRLRLWFPDDLQDPSNSEFGNNNQKSNYWLGPKYHFEVAQFLPGDYVVLNAKNLFVKPINLETWKDIIGSGSRTSMSIGDEPDIESWINGNKLFAEYLKTESRDNLLLGCVTPQVVNKNLLINKLGDFKEFSKFWTECATAATNGRNLQLADWYFYSYLIPKEQVEKLPTHPSHFFLFWSKTIESRKKSFKQLLKMVDETESFKLTGFHRFFLRNLSAPDRILLNKWLREKGFKTKLRPPTKFYK